MLLIYLPVGIILVLFDLMLILSVGEITVMVNQPYHQLLNQRLFRDMFMEIHISVWEHNICVLFSRVQFRVLLMVLKYRVMFSK